jgi:ubiquinone/menaquinone biosynthesis C-methylase UbiE
LATQTPLTTRTLAPVDDYTARTRRWLDQRFSQTDGEGIFFAHQPIYGFHGAHSEANLIDKYLRSYHIVRALAHIRFNTLLDVGGADGYKAALIRHLLRKKTYSSDLSEQACRRAHELFQLSGAAADVHHLPFADGAFDVVLCSETLEHVSDPRAATEELLRISRCAVVITVPHETEEEVHHNIEEGIPHAHIHRFEPDTFDWVNERWGFPIARQRLINPVINAAGIFVEGRPREAGDAASIRGIAARLYNRITPILERTFDERAESKLMRLDRIVCKHSSSYGALLFVLLKDRSCWGPAHWQITPEEVLKFSVPYQPVKQERRQPAGRAA